jgi:SAM-dependent methyltransferase
MAIDIHRELHAGLSTASPARLSFTCKAFEMLPPLETPQILDVGCGSGDPTLELARLSGGQVIGLDVDPSALAELAKRAEEEGLSSRIQVVNRSMLEMDFPDESFDLIWAEGSLHVVGFEKALRDWRGLLKPGGFLVVHEMAWLRADPPPAIRSFWQRVFPGIRTVSEYVEAVRGHGYDLVGHFALPEDFWWREYYAPLQARIWELRSEYADDPAAQSALDSEQQDVDMYKKHATWYGSAFLLMQKVARRGDS